VIQRFAGRKPDTHGPTMVETVLEALPHGPALAETAIQVKKDVPS
jgi:hypothetical protein